MGFIWNWFVGKIVFYCKIWGIFENIEYWVFVDVFGIFILWYEVVDFVRMVLFGMMVKCDWSLMLCWMIL